MEKSFIAKCVEAMRADFHGERRNMKRRMDRKHKGLPIIRTNMGLKKVENGNLGSKVRLNQRKSQVEVANWSHESRNSYDVKYIGN